MSRSRRQWLKGTLAALGVTIMKRESHGFAAPAQSALPPDASTRTYDFGQSGIAGWTVVSGQWAVEDLPDAPGAQKVLVQRATRNEFNVIVAPDAVSDADISVKLKPISGREDASGGIVFRFDQGRYYVVRANALENNFRLYFYDRGRRQIATTSVKPPALGQWHTVRVVAVGDHVQAWLDDVLYLDHRDTRLKSGRVGLWTKADSVTAFHGLTVRAPA